MVSGLSIKMDYLYHPYYCLWPSNTAIIWVTELVVDWGQERNEEKSLKRPESVWISQSRLLKVYISDISKCADQFWTAFRLKFCLNCNFIDKLKKNPDSNVVVKRVATSYSGDFNEDLGKNDEHFFVVFDQFCSNFELLSFSIPIVVFYRVANT